jgi:hypothetical protein
MSFPSDPLHILYASLGVIAFWAAVYAIAHALTADKETKARPLRRVTMVREEEPVVADRYYACMKCGRQPDPDHVPYCVCGCGLASIVDATDATPTWPGDGGRAA